MRAVDIIIKKRDHQELIKKEIDFFINGYTKEEIPDYQAAALCMAILLNGMTDRETTDLTLAMANSGEILDLRSVVPFAVDKHSTGGVGDKTTLVVEPIVAACGLPVGKMSGRGLGFSGGTLDKLESIPGYRTDLTVTEFILQLRQIGMVLTGQSANLAPADGKLYALRDVTGTVQSLPLIAASVMSKKIASGAQGIVLDVKWGNGAFMPTLKEAEKLAKLMVSIATLAGRKSIALLAGMNQPLGNSVGNALELVEALETLQGHGPADFREHCLVIASQMLAIGGITQDSVTGKELAENALISGKAWECFRLLVRTQGGDISFIDHPEKLPQAKITNTIFSKKTGYIKKISARTIGEVVVLLGGGRTKKGDAIDHEVGIKVLKKVGNYIDRNEPLFVVFAKKEIDFESAKTLLDRSYDVSEEPVDSEPLFNGIIQPKD